MTVDELKNEIQDIGRHLNEQAQVLQTISSRLNQAGALTSNVMNQTSRSDVAQPAVEGILGASQQAANTAATLVNVKEVLEQYAATL